MMVAVALALAGCPPAASNKPGRSFLGACGANQVKACVGQCVTPVGLGQPCYLDPCHPLAIGTAIDVCAGNLRCDPTPVPGDVVGGGMLPPGTGICREAPNNGAIPTACDPRAVPGSLANPCPHNPGWFCSGVVNPSCGVLPANLPAGAQGFCTLPLGEGDTNCDGD